MSNPEHYVDVFTLPGFLSAMRRHRMKMLAAFALAAATTVLIVASREREYSSSAKLFVRIGRETVSMDPTAGTGGGMISVTNTQEREIHSIISVLHNRDLLEQVVDELGPQTILNYSEDGDSNEGSDEKSVATRAIESARATVKSTLDACGLVNDVSDRERAVQCVRDSLSVDSGDSSSAVITVSFKATSPKLAQMVVSKVIDLQLVYHMQANSTPGSLPFFTTQTERLRSDLEAAADELAALKNENGVASLDAKKAALESQMESLNEKMSQAAADLAATSSTVESLTQQLSSETELVPSAEIVGMAGDTKATMRQELYRLQILESELLAKLKTAHPKVAEIRDQIEQARSVFDDEKQQVQTTQSTNVVYQQVRINLMSAMGDHAALNARIEALELERNKLNKEIARINDGEVQLANLQRTVDLLDSNYRRYVEDLEQVRINKELETLRISNVNVIQKPSYVDYPVGAGNLMVLALGLIASCGFAFSVVVLIELILPAQAVIRRPQPRYHPTELSKVEEAIGSVAHTEYATKT